jgi:hypothetical protein
MRLSPPPRYRRHPMRRRHPPVPPVYLGRPSRPRPQLRPLPPPPLKSSPPPSMASSSRWRRSPRAFRARVGCLGGFDPYAGAGSSLTLPYPYGLTSYGRGAIRAVYGGHHRPHHRDLLAASAVYAHYIDPIPTIAIANSGIYVVAASLPRPAAVPVAPSPSSCVPRGARRSYRRATLLQTLLSDVRRPGRSPWVAEPL